MALGAGRQLRRQADNPLAGGPAMQADVDSWRRGLNGGMRGAEGDYQQDRAGMGSALAGLQGLADGTGPSLAQEQLANQSEKNIAATMAAMGSARGGNLNAAQMGAATAGVGMAQDTNAAMAELRAGEQINALNAAGGLASTMAGMSSGRQLELGGMSQQALLEQYGGANQREMARAGMVADRLDTRNRNRLQWANFGLNAAGQALGVGATFSDVRVKCKIMDAPSIAQALAELGEDGEDDEDDEDRFRQEYQGCWPRSPDRPDPKHKACRDGGGEGGRSLVDALLEGGCGDEDEDDDDEHPDGPLGVVMGLFSPAQRKGASAELGNVRPYSFEYDEDAKAAGMPEGEIVGVMAQDLEAAGPRGKAAVYDHPAGPKALHPSKSIGLALAAAADHEDRMRKLEQLLGIGRG